MIDAFVAVDAGPAAVASHEFAAEYRTTSVGWTPAMIAAHVAPVPLPPSPIVIVGADV
jgi:hypothetical protein